MMTPLAIHFRATKHAGEFRDLMLLDRRMALRFIGEQLENLLASHELLTGSLSESGHLENGMILCRVRDHQTAIGLLTTWASRSIIRPWIRIAWMNLGQVDRFEPSNYCEQAGDDAVLDELETAPWVVAWPPEGCADFGKAFAPAMAAARTQVDSETIAGVLTFRKTAQNRLHG